MSLRIFYSTCSLGVLVLAGCLVGCGPSHSGEHGGGGISGSGDLGSAGGGGGGGGSISTDMSTGTPAPTSITITPNPALVNVTVTDGTVATMPLTFTASDENGNPITASWQIDKGEFGALTAGGGVFTANGLNAGTATVTATAGNVQATAMLTIAIATINTGANSGSGTGPQTPVDGGAPPGGYNGVGGVPLGGAPPATTVTVLQNGTGSDATFKFLYPYDGTVFPRGILPPLLQWSVPTTPTTFNATAIWVHLKQANYDFQGYYAGNNLVNAPIDAAAWTAATNSNSGDPLVVELKITDGTNVLGPLTQSWTIAPSRLRGTVYYNTYDSHLNTGTTNGSDGNGAVLAIQPGGFQPQLAIPSQLGKCYACHEVSADGSTLFTATTDANTNDGAVFDLKQSPPAQVSTYSGGTTGGMFTYGGIYPDGTMGLVSSQEDYHAYGGNSNLYAAANEAAVPTTGFSTVVTRAVTPTFSPDGAHAAFNFRTGTGVAGVAPGIGELAIMDFACGAPAGSVTCNTASPYTFSGLRELFAAPANHYVGWPSFTPDSKMVVFQHTVTPCTDGGSQLNTRSGAQAEILARRRARRRRHGALRAAVAVRHQRLRPRLHDQAVADERQQPRRRRAAQLRAQRHAHRLGRLLLGRVHQPPLVRQRRHHRSLFPRAKRRSADRAADEEAVDGGHRSQPEGERRSEPSRVLLAGPRDHVGQHEGLLGQRALPRVGHVVHDRRRMLHRLLQRQRRGLARVRRQTARLRPRILEVQHQRRLLRHRPQLHRQLVHHFAHLLIHVTRSQS